MIEWPSQDLSDRLRDLRIRAGLHQVDVARRMNLDASVTGLWEKGKRMVPSNRIRALAAALEVSPEVLTGLSESELRRRLDEQLPVQAIQPPAPALDTAARHPLSDLVICDPPVPIPRRPRIPKSIEPLRWCNSSHGARDGVGNLLGLLKSKPGKPGHHHHGVRPAWAPGFESQRTFY